MILLIIPILFICLFIIPGLYHFCKKEKDDIVTVENKLDLFNLHTNKEVWKGLVVLVKDTNTKYILTSIDFDNNEDTGARIQTLGAYAFYNCVNLAYLHATEACYTADLCGKHLL